MRAATVLLTGCWFLLCTRQLRAQVSKPIATNDQVDVKSSKYLQRVAEDDVHNADRCVYTKALGRAS